MTATSTQAITATQPERCCPVGQCAYSVTRVKLILTVIRVARERGDDPGEMAASVLGSRGDGRSPGASAGSDTTRHATAVCDVLRAVEAIGGRPGAEAIADWLCPFSSDDHDDL